MTLHTALEGILYPKHSSNCARQSLNSIVSKEQCFCRAYDEQKRQVKELEALFKQQMEEIIDDCKESSWTDERDMYFHLGEDHIRAELRRKVAKI